jgi:glycosyltransferase involved in cell wall biosynthesis
VARLHAAGRDVRCLIVGDGTIRDDLEKLAQKHGIADRTIFTGEVDHRTVRSYYEAIDIFVVPRRADYAADYVTPLKPFEALALGRPLIMSDRPVAAEIVGDEERGLLFKTGDHDHLATTIARLLDDPDRRRALVDAGRAWVETERTWRRNAEAYRRVYATIAASHML